MKSRVSSVEERQWKTSFKASHWVKWEKPVEKFSFCSLWKVEQTELNKFFGNVLNF